MTVPSFYFLGYALLCALLFNLAPRGRWQQAVLLCVNLYFIQAFATGWQQLIPYAGFLLLGYVGIEIRRSVSSWTTWILPWCVLAVFVWLKRYLFVPSGLLLHQGYLTVGLSYVFFRVMHLVLDGYPGLPRGVQGATSYLNYTLNFTSLVSGPIQRYEDYQKSEAGGSRLSRTDILQICERIISGFFKVAVVSAALRWLHDKEIAALGMAHGLPATIGIASLVAGIYPVYLFYNFSGYTDVVIAVARCFNLQLPENFNHPFSAASVLNFWTRWHISLSQWLKTYVYNPLLVGLLRRFPSPAAEPVSAVIAFFVTFFLIGVWHGQTSEFIVFGLLTGGGVAANKIYQIAMTKRLGRSRYGKICKNALYTLLMRGLTFTWFAFTMLWFWSSWGQLHGFLSTLGLSGCIGSVALLFLISTMALFAITLAHTRIQSIQIWGESIAESRYVRVVLAGEMAAVIIFMATAMNAATPRIVYQAF
jgi:alginate O-acetyltransferase complex protein AlgI